MRGVIGHFGTERVRSEWYDSASPSVSFLDISPAKAGGEFRASSGSSLGSLDGLKEAPSVSFLDISPAKA
ncbi:MAG: hypothetical protein M3092_06365, partial [Actinomycetia bacterium]|nr:hypothetical protein [Actinomycetes bacterium]